MQDFKQLKVWQKSRHLLLACDLNFLGAPVAAELLGDVEEIKRMLASLITKLKTSG